MNQKPALCCPTPAVKNGLHPHEITSGSTGIPTTPGYACTNPLFVSACGPATPPEDITLTGQDCDGAALPATGAPGQLVSIVQEPGQAITVRLCKDQADYEKTILCDKNTGHKVAVITTFDGSATPTVTFWDINAAAAWAGSVDDLESCPDTDLESDAIEMCDAGVQFLRWVVKSNGEPTGSHFDTDASGTPYVVTDEAIVTIGKCEAVALPQSVSSATGDNLSSLAEGTSFAVYKDNCCSIKLKTSIGNIIIPKTATAYSTQIFKTPFTIDAVEIVSGTCDLANVTIISNLSA